jgi:hypothetical protein
MSYLSNSPTLNALFDAWCFDEPLAFEAMIDYALDHDLEGALQDLLWDRFDSYLSLFEYDLVEADVFHAVREQSNQVLAHLGFRTW